MTRWSEDSALTERLQGSSYEWSAQAGRDRVPLEGRARVSLLNPGT